MVRNGAEGDSGAAARELDLHLRAISALDDYERALEDEPLAGLDELIARRARELFWADAAVTARFDEARRELVVKNFSWERESEGILERLIGRGLTGMGAPIGEEEYRLMMELQVGAASSLHELSFGKVPKPVSDAIERSLGIAWFRGLVLASHGELFGALGLAGGRGRPPPRPELLRVFARITASAIKRREAEERVAQLLQEKDLLLLHEVHHRIKNNMSTMVSLLSIQAGASANEETRRALHDAMGRLQSMGLLYDKLYRAEDLRAMSLAVYLPALVKAAVEQYPDAARVEVRTDIEDIPLDAKPLSLLGIMINELVANSMKYAFPGEKGGSIAVSAKLRRGLVEIAVEDDGIGLPEGVDLCGPDGAEPRGSKGFGLGLVRLLAEQLGGSVRLERGKGARFVIEFRPA